MKRIYLVLAAALVLIGGFIIASWGVKNQRAAESENLASQPESVLVREHSPRMGDADARVTIVEFFDPACGTCASFHGMIKEMLNEYAGQVNLVVRYAPLHQGSPDIVRILEAARLQGLFWEALELAYQTQSRWTVNHRAYPDRFWQLVQTLELDGEKLLADVQSDAVTNTVRQDVADAQALNVDKTPGFFVNGRPLVNFGYRELQALVEAELGRK